MSKSLTSARGRAYRCQLCKADPMTAEKRRVVAHILKYHTPLDRSPFYCTVCLFKALSMDELLQHVTSYPAHRQKIDKMRNQGQAVTERTGLEQSPDPIDVFSHMEILTTSESEGVWTSRRGATSNEKATEQVTESVVTPDFWELLDSLSETATVPEYVPTPLVHLKQQLTPGTTAPIASPPRVPPCATIPTDVAPSSHPPRSAENTNCRLLEKLLTTVETVGSAIVDAVNRQTQQFALLRATLMDTRCRHSGSSSSDFSSSDSSSSDSDSDPDADSDADINDHPTDRDADADSDSDDNADADVTITLDSDDILQLIAEERESEEANFRELIEKETGRTETTEKLTVAPSEGMESAEEQKAQETRRTEPKEKVKETGRTETKEKVKETRKTETNEKVKETGRTETKEKAKETGRTETKEKVKETGRTETKEKMGKSRKEKDIQKGSRKKGEKSSELKRDTREREQTERRGDMRETVDCGEREVEDTRLGEGGNIMGTVEDRRVGIDGREKE